MYPVDGRDSVVELRDVPQSDVGSPRPVVVGDEHRLHLIYAVQDTAPNWTGEDASEGELIASVTFLRHRAQMFGPPNDEAFTGHPLASRGLRPYAAWEVAHSSWIRALERMNSVHTLHRPESFAKLRHFIFAFHDSTFECVAEGYEVKVARGLIGSVARAALLVWD